MDYYHRINFAYQGRHAPAKLASMATRSMATTLGANKNQNWLTDTSASDHITPDLSQLSLAQQPAIGESVIVGNGQDLPVTHIGNGKLITSSHNFCLNNILRVPRTASNLLSIHKLCLPNNAFCYFDAYRFLIQDLPRGKVLYRGLSKDRVYPMPSSTLPSSSPSHPNSSGFVALPPQFLLWHNRLGHPCAKVLHSAMSSFPSVKVSCVSDICSKCTSCISAKMHKTPFPTHVSNTEYPFQLVHSDVWGPAPVTFVLDHRFYVIFVDDFTRFTWLFLLKRKSDVFQVFLHFYSLVETQFSAKIKTLRSDGGGEFVNANFK